MMCFDINWRAQRGSNRELLSCSRINTYGSDQVLEACGGHDLNGLPVEN